ncbi:MAG: hypothetical protein IJU37_11955 [Desulfovibrio sp.]|nr:hypothetical protein [Desulfovibrio sp.]
MNKNSENSVNFPTLDKLPQSTQSKILESEIEKLRLVFIGKFFGRNPQIHYVSYML